MTSRSTRILSLSAAALLMSVPLAGHAQQQSPSQQPQMQPTQPQSGAMQSGSSSSSQAVQNAQQAQQQVEQLAAQGEKLVGKDVYGANNEKVGAVKDVVVGPDSKVNAVLVDIGGFLGIGAKTVSLPLAQLKAEGDRVVASNLTKEQAKAIPEYKEPNKNQGQQKQGG